MKQTIKLLAYGRDNDEFDNVYLEVDIIDGKIQLAKPTYVEFG